MRELMRMQKLDHIRVQVSQKTDRYNSSWANRTTNDFNHGSALEAESLTQDSLFVNRDEMPASATGNLRASLTGTPRAAIGMSTSSQFRSI